MTAPSIIRPQPVPPEFAGKWVAWTPNGIYPIAAGDTPEAAKQAATARGANPALRWAPGMGVAIQWVPPRNEHFIGSTPL
jgi:hypothetical protein